MAELRIDVSEVVNRAVDKLIESGWRPSEWIPCREMLPEVEKDVIVYTKAWEEHIQIAHIMGDGIMWELSDGEFYFPMFDVTHWMPLPEPPEKE